MALNEELSWNEVGQIDILEKGKPTGKKVQDSFQLMFGEPTKELLDKEMSLYKFSDYGTLAAGAVTDETPLSPWWSPTLAFKHDAGLVERMAIAEKNGVSFREWGRLTSVIKEDWSSLEWLLIVELKVEVYGWFGGFKGMERVGDKEKSKRDKALEASGASKGLPGGGTQFYIPNLKIAHIGRYEFRPL